MRRLLLLLVTVVLGWLWLRRFAARPAAAPPRTGAPRETAGPMVRDRICNTFLPRSRALVLGSGEETRFFCSEACRDKYLAGRA